MDIEVEKVSNGIQKIKAGSYEGFVNYILKFPNDKDYIYRGQREPNWKMLPSSARTGVTREHPLDEFRKASRGLRGNNPPELKDNSMWALGQHHGLNTPLLDWTESPFVAAFFAFSHPRKSTNLPKSRVVFALDHKIVKKKSEKIKPKNTKSGQIKFENKKKTETFPPENDIIKILYPEEVDDNKRLLSQQGLFTKHEPFNSNIHIEKWIKMHFSGVKLPVLIRIEIMERDKGDREAFLRLLHKMNINYLTLFPDLDGACKYVNMCIEIGDY